MKQQQSLPDPESRRVRVLSESVARKIAAGEVIDRPYAAVRELLDNAIDSYADEITCHLITKQNKAACHQQSIGCN